MIKIELIKLKINNDPIEQLKKDLNHFNHTLPDTPVNRAFVIAYCKERYGVNDIIFINWYKKEGK